MSPIRTVITGTGSFIPENKKINSEFAIHDFYDDRQQRIPNAAVDIIKKFEQITGIYERRYANQEMNASDMAAIAAAVAIKDAGIDPESIDQIIVAQNFGNVSKHTIQSDAVPSLASRVKHILGIKNPSCIPYDLLFGCPGWIQGLIHAEAFFKSGQAKRCLVIGTETLSRVIDNYDRDSMIFSDGAGAVIVEAQEGEAGSGVLGAVAQSFVIDELNYIFMGKSYFPEADSRIRYIKMQGRKVYEFSLKHVPEAMKGCLEKSNVDIKDIKKIFIHQANEKMDIAIIKAFYMLYDISTIPLNIMPMNIKELGNSSVATVPTLFDMVKRGTIPDHELKQGDIVLFASVGAGMNINAICYKL
ncbi:3-oxoacyl-[acyl-carrier-protein] synthase-3 [Chitinophaga sp. YR573]|uniref:3-oxoacyl-ACP synthase III family protein n=1 Tax=Chitinophaga sp. YR573 TaxID=1881040 RepID=UPI0008CDCD44|nr:ketoacyl-ACP synthase III [Chitinophaga sp. YR573]SEW46345.1 3-oxoacyl-[acyl-carrier-protein] synthase-3 [Chitinophaga sp. YR573]